MFRAMFRPSSGAFTVFTVSGRVLGEHYQILQIHSSTSDYGRKHRPKHVEPPWNNKLIYIVHLVGYFHSCITMHGFMNVKNWIVETYGPRGLNDKDMY
jgi:hypothetical protein